MATYYSDQYTTTTSGTSVESGVSPSSGGSSTTAGAPIRGGTTQWHQARITVPAAGVTNDVIRLMTFSSSARVLQIMVSSDATLAAVTDLDCDIGLYLTGDDNDGAVIDLDLFAVDIDLSSAGVDRAEAFVQSTTLSSEDRGKPLWAVADAGGGSFSEDPRVDFDLTIDLATVTGTVTAGVCLVEVETVGRT